MQLAEYHISSAVVHVRPASLEAVQGVIAAMEGVEIHVASATGKLVITLETPSERDVARQMEAIQAMSGVLSATLVYHQVEAGPLD